VRGHDGILRLPSDPVFPHPYKHPEPEKHVDAELGLHHEKVGAGDEVHHQIGGDVSQVVGVLGKVAEKVYPEPGKAGLKLIQIIIVTYKRNGTRVSFADQDHPSHLLKSRLSVDL
jgi:hypothetical protein